MILCKLELTFLVLLGQQWWWSVVTCCLLPLKGFSELALSEIWLLAIDSFLFLHHPGSVTSVPLTLNLRAMLTTVSLGAFSAFAIFLYPDPCL